jgi:hypothetical protein
MNDFLKGLALSMARSAEAQSSLPAPTQQQIDASRQLMFGSITPPVMLGSYTGSQGGGLFPQTIPTGTGSSNLSISTNIPTPGGSTANLINQLPALRGTGTGESRIDPSLRPYLELGLRRGEQLFFGEQQPSLYPGQMYVSPSQQTLDALAAQESLARQSPSALQAGQQAYGQALGGFGFTAGGGFLGGSPYRDAMIESAIRPIYQQFEQSTLPGIQSAFSRAGRYGSGAQAQAIGQATEATSRAMGDVAAQLAASDYARERQLMQQAMGQQVAAAQLAPQFFASQFLPSQQLAQVGEAREAISAQPLQEAMTRYQFAQQLPYQQLQTFLSGVYGTPMASSQYASVPQARTNTTAQILGGAATLGALIPERQRAQAIDYITSLLG